ncbi:hypothetical protein [Duganella callida]|uniref:HeH/LEM domain-containing protein n=1 Tax=Duganella callida TaxID=2561932 RepID=A0A4Y9S459_9BURK|nr:hypothetical protein [Duganella callida]TFW15961.1 hypothetical protein E4L98_25035 [Duganella callida]
MTTIKIKSTDPDSQGPFVIIEKADFNPDKHELFEGESLGDGTGAVGLGGDGVPTLAELMSGAKQLQARKEQLDDFEMHLNQRASLLDEREQAVLAREQANEAEALRLAALAAAGTTSAPTDPAAMSKEQLHAALDAKGTKYPAAANKAELVALLTGA